MTVLTLFAAVAVPLALRDRSHPPSTEQRLAGLGVDLSIERFRELLGAPEIVNTADGVSENVFVLPDVIVDAATDSTDKVIFFSVSYRAGAGFHPSFRRIAETHCSGGLPTTTVCIEPPAVVLGVTHAAELGAPEGVAAYNGAHDVGYSEVHYYGNSGNYNYFYFGYNQAARELGTVDTSEPDSFGGASWLSFAPYNGLLRTGIFLVGRLASVYPPLVVLPPPKELEQLRQDLVINFYAVSTPDFDLVSQSELSISLAQPRALVFGPKIRDIANVPK